MTVTALIIIGAIVQFFAELPYIRNTLLGRSKPNRVTFFLWSLVPMIAVLVGWSAGGTWSLVPVFMSGFAPFLIFVASFRNPNAYWKLGLFDYLCGAFAIIAIFLWQVTNEPVLAIIFSIIADGLAGLPTQIKCWLHPETETGTGYLASFINVVIGLFAVQTWLFPEYGFLAFLVIANASLTLGVYHRNPLEKLKQEFAR